MGERRMRNAYFWGIDFTVAAPSLHLSPLSHPMTSAELRLSIDHLPFSDTVAVSFKSNLSTDSLRQDCFCCVRMGQMRASWCFHSRVLLSLSAGGRVSEGETRVFV
mmetsp:Transcript_13190/g.25956  ORF Transcript_13190/g.25956 Transcript_13190/m.25956 type:complete len:106 (-) Transcript_13190:226-543(-)